MTSLRCFVLLSVSVVWVFGNRPAAAEPHPDRSVIVATIDGRVWLDANQNGLFDAGEQGVAGCLVSDGIQLVRTDADGYYHLEPGSARLAVFVVNLPGTWPAGPW